MAGVTHRRECPNGFVHSHIKYGVGSEPVEGPKGGSWFDKLIPNGSVPFYCYCKVQSPRPCATLLGGRHLGGYEADEVSLDVLEVGEDDHTGDDGYGHGNLSAELNGPIE